MKRIKKGVTFFLLLFILSFTTPFMATESLAATTPVKVTLEILWNGASAKVNNSTYYVTAYSDSACTKSVSTKKIKIENDSTGSVIFYNLSVGTYYFAESNSSGTLKIDTSTLTISYPTGNIVTVANSTYSADNTTVYIPKTGEKYHSSSTCSGMNNPEQVSLATAQERGYEPCSKCYTGTADTKILRIQNNYSVDPNYASARTADESQPLLYSGIALLSVIVAGGVILIRRKENL